jgi:hypothetical protein
MTQTLSQSTNVGFYDSSLESGKILQYMEHVYNKNSFQTKAFWEEANIDSRFRAGDQNYGRFACTGNSRPVTINHIMRTCNLITGHQRRSRKSLIVTPVNDSSLETSDDLSKTLFSVMKMASLQNTISTAFDSTITTGLSLLSLWVDYREDPVSGDIKVDSKPYSSFFIDPNFRKQDLSDCQYIWTRRWVSKNVAKSLLPGNDKEIDRLRFGGSGDGKFSSMPEAYDIDFKGLLSYDEFWYQDFRKQKLLIDIETGGSIEWMGSNEDLKKFLKDFPDVIEVDSTIPTTKLAIVIQDELFYHGNNPLGIDRYPFVPVLGYFYPEIPSYDLRVQGVVRSLRDVQALLNRRRTEEMDILESHQTTGWIYRAGALIDPKSVFKTGQGRGIALKEDSSPGDLEKITPPVIPPSMFEMSKILTEEIQQISGVNEELLGSAIDDKAGYLSMIRQGAGLTTLQTLFDQLDYSFKQVGSIVIELIQKNYTPGKIERIIGKKPTKEFYSKAFGKYDVVVEEGIDSSTQKAIEFQQLMSLEKMGVPIPKDSYIAATTVQGKKRLYENILLEEQKTKDEKELLFNLEVEDKKASTRDKNARAEANRGLGLERGSRVQENRALAVERIAKAQREKAQAVLEIEKGFKELKSLGLDNAHSGIELYGKIRESNAADSMIDRQQVEKPNLEELAVLSKQEENQQPQEKGSNVKTEQ